VITHLLVNTLGTEFSLDCLSGKIHPDLPLFKLNGLPKTRENDGISKLIRSCVHEDVNERRKLPDFKRAVTTLFKLEK
jgi:hypothetical protein